MFDLVSKMTSINSQRAINAIILAKNERRFSNCALLIIKAIKENPGISQVDLHNLTKVSQSQISSLSNKLIEEFVIRKYPSMANGRYAVRYKLTKSNKEVDSILKHNAKLRSGIVMSNIDKQIYSVIIENKVCSVSFISEALDMYDSYVLVYINRLIKGGVVCKAKLEGVKYVKCVYMATSLIEGIQ